MKNKIGNTTTRTIAKCVLYVLILILLKKTKIISVPSGEEMVEFQFNLITVSTVFAGFSFSVLGMLMGMYSQPLMQKLGDTTIVTNKSIKIKKSIFYFCVSGAVSLLYILGIDSFIVSVIPKVQSSLQYAYIACILSLIIGIVYFLISTVGVFKIISKIYGCNTKRFEEEKEIYKKAKAKINK